MIFGHEMKRLLQQGFANVFLFLQQLSTVGLPASDKHGDALLPFKISMPQDLSCFWKTFDMGGAFATVAYAEVMNAPNGKSAHCSARDVSRKSNQHVFVSRYGTLNCSSNTKQNYKVFLWGILQTTLPILSTLHSSQQFEQTLTTWTRKQICNIFHLYQL